MKRASLITSLALFLGCGSSDGGSTTDAAVTGDGPPPTADSSTSPTADGAVTADTAPTTTDGATASDAAAPAADGGTMTMTPAQIPAMGDHYCQAGPQASVDAQLLLGVDKTCLITQAPMSPLTADQKKAYDYACSFYGGAMPVADCPRDNVVAYCAGQGLTPLIGGMVPPVTKGWKLIYKSTVLPDTDTVALNAFGLCAGGTLYDAAGAAIPPRTCKGTVTAKINGVVKSFSERRVCSLRTIGTKAEFAFIGDTTTDDRLTILIARDAMGMSKLGNFVSPYTGYLEGGTNKTFLSNPAMQTVTTTKFEDKNAVLTGTFTIGEVKGGNETRTITDGVIDLTITP